MQPGLPRLFHGLPYDDVEAALGRCESLSVDVGTRLIEEGETDRALILLTEGRLEISTGGVVLGTAEAGDVVGEVALFGAGIRTASVESLTPASMLLLDRVGYIELRNLGNPVAHALEEHTLGLLTRRLASTSRRIAELAEGTPAQHVIPPKGFFAKVGEIFGVGSRGSGPRDFDAARVLADMPLFAEATEEALDTIADAMEVASFSAGAFLCVEGEIGAELFVIASGAVEVVVTTAVDRVEPLATLRAGEALGMCSLIEHQPRMASCIAAERTLALSLDREAYRELANAPTVAGSVLRTAMIRALAEQLAYANAQLAQLDLTRQVKQLTAERAALDPVLRASAGLEAYGRHLGGPARR